MTFPGFAEEHGANFAAGAESFFGEAHAFDADGAGFSRKSAAKGDAESFEPAIVAAGEESRTGRSGGCAAVGRADGFGGYGHAEWRVARLEEGRSNEAMK
jgi:hypothetical protein